MSVPRLPIELWLVIFRWATISRITHLLCTTLYRPFQTDTAEAVDRDAVSVKRVLVLVCKQWRLAAMDLLLEDVILHNDVATLLRVLDGQYGVGRAVVRRACIPYSSCDSYKSSIHAASAFLSDYSSIETLVRPPFSHFDKLQFDFPVEDCPALASLRRLDWWHQNDAARSGGLNSLTDVLKAAPNLEYLSLGGDMQICFLHQTPLSLLALTTLRIRPMHALLLAPFNRWKLPSLKHIIVDTYNGSLPQNFWAAFGGQIETIELGHDIKFCLVDMVQYLLGVCPNLKELNYRVQFTAMPSIAEEHAALTTVRLHAVENAFFSGEGDGLWEHLEGHFVALSSARLSALRRIVFHGDCTRLLRNGRFHTLLQQVLDAGREVEFSD